MPLDKKLLRQQLIKKRSKLDHQTHTLLSRRVIDNLKCYKFFQQAHTIAVYLSFQNEVDTWQLIKEIIPFKQVCVPVINESNKMEFVFIDDLEHLSKNKYGIYEPISGRIADKDAIDLIVVPLVGYNDLNYRLGYGGGYYDRYLAQYTGKKIGIAFQLQRTEKFVAEAYDVALDIIITE